MEILYIANARIPTEKAHGLQIAQMADNFSLAGCRLTLLIPRRKNKIKENIFDYYNLKGKFKIKYVPNYFSFLEGISKKLYFKLQRISFYKHAIIIGLFSKADIIYSREIVICFFLSLFGKKVVLEDHEPRKSKIFLYKLFLKKIGKKIVVPFKLVELYQSFGIAPETYKVVPNGVDLEIFSKTKAEHNIWPEEYGIKADKIILYVGHLYQWKGIYTLVDAAPKLAYPIILMGGTKEDQEAVRNYIKEKKIDNVYLLGFQSHDKAIRAIKSADVLVLPNTAKETRSAKYTTPIKLFEYMASGVPIVASDLESFDNYLKDQENAILFAADNADDLAAKIKYIFDNPQVARNISDKALKDVRQFTWQNRARQILEFIKS